MIPRELDEEEKRACIGRITARLSREDEVLFAYLFGSFRKGSFRDIDIAVYLRGGYDARHAFRFEAAIERELEEVTGIPVDVRVLNGAPLPFSYTVVQTGLVIFSRDERSRSDFVCRLLAEYHDFAYYRRRYRREALGLLR